ncbi:hypothetical protein CDAR_218141 [Caerostris darwini]|uniref:Uncharacterized protein n=1 Tax=Caerostris darwini TaxID=1538125 RepID=A0AAV4TF56_9ARAC|nr:hypothetical protein CDAR_218141 [Caerostris darwini]
MRQEMPGLLSPWPDSDAHLPFPRITPSRSVALLALLPLPLPKWGGPDALLWTPLQPLRSKKGCSKKFIMSILGTDSSEAFSLVPFYHYLSDFDKNFLYHNLVMNPKKLWPQHKSVKGFWPSTPRTY